MSECIITGCDAVHPDRRGGQHVAMRCTGVLVIDDDRGVGVLINSERSQHKNIERARKVLAGLAPTLLVLGHNLVIAGALSYATERVGSGRCCRVCDAPTTRESWERTVDGCPACWRRG